MKVTQRMLDDVEMCGFLAGLYGRGEDDDVFGCDADWPETVRVAWAKGREEGMRGDAPIAVPGAENRMAATDAALLDVRAEVARAVAKYPAFNSAHEGFAVIREELDGLWDDVKANRTERAIEEAVQVAAMAVRFITDMRAKQAGGSQPCPPTS
ncbi:hypothetical protein F1189_13380 [Rhodovastum atsumiense]|uniref:Uncharacterized protein n=1 Tax=Rhodovastum atsumiense TaxID=504468 RepID=A0A5M6ITG5_9PROT|nr:hypothetical protein F1189_13380 [Rhodovastum atsumiense]